MSKNSVAVCKESSVDFEKVKAVLKKLPQHEEIVDLSQTFKILGDPTRIKIVLALAQQEMCVCDLATLINLTVSGVSHQLRLLRNLKLVKYRKEGKMVYYSIDDEHIEQIINLAQIHVREK